MAADYLVSASSACELPRTVTRLAVRVARSGAALRNGAAALYFSPRPSRIGLISSPTGIIRRTGGRVKTDASLYDAATRIDVEIVATIPRRAASVECNSASECERARTVNSWILCKIDAARRFAATSALRSTRVREWRDTRSIEETREECSLKFLLSPRHPRVKERREALLVSRKDFEKNAKVRAGP